jgi:hypothetical protein
MKKIITFTLTDTGNKAYLTVDNDLSLEREAAKEFTDQDELNTAILEMGSRLDELLKHRGINWKLEAIEINRELIEKEFGDRGERFISFRVIS